MLVYAQSTTKLYRDDHTIRKKKKKQSNKTKTKSCDQYCTRSGLKPREYILFYFETKMRFDDLCLALIIMNFAVDWISTIII